MPSVSEHIPNADPTRSRIEAELEAKVSASGARLSQTLGAVLAELPTSGPQALADHLQINKVLASRLLKAMREPDPVAVIHRMPGPDPLRRVIRAASKKGVDAAITSEAMHAVKDFDELINDDVGDRSGLEAILSAWIPDARRDFELSRKQTAYRAMSQIKGCEVQTRYQTAILNPSAGGEKIDVVWVNGFHALRRLRPGALVKFVSRRIAGQAPDRRPCSLDGRPVTEDNVALLPEFSSVEAPDIRVVHSDEVVHYVLGDTGIGPRSDADLVFAEVNLDELQRYFPAGSDRRAFVYAEVSTPAKVFTLDLLVHNDLYQGQDPALAIYDTLMLGTASVNDRSRDIDRYVMNEAVSPLGVGLHNWRSSDAPRYLELLGHTFDSLGWDASKFRGYRCRIDYAIYGSQVALSFGVESRPEA